MRRFVGRAALVGVAISALGLVALGCGPHHAAGHSCAAPASPPASQKEAAFASPPPVGAVARCPVTGESFTVTATTARSEHRGRHFAFCCPGCKAKFDGDPDRYAK